MATHHRKPSANSDLDSDPAFVPAIPSMEPESDRPARVVPTFGVDPDPASDGSEPTPETPPRFPKARKSGSGEFARLPVRETVVDPEPPSAESDGKSGDDVSGVRAALAPSEATLRERIAAEELGDAWAVADLDDEEPPRLESADFVLKRRIGRGGQADVWRALQPSLDREIAVKIIRSDRRDEAAGFLQEAFTSAELDHPNIAPVYELSQSRVEGRDCHVLAMKLIKGKGWHEQLLAERASPGFSLELFLAKHLKILADVCNAVSYAHSKGIIHRDIKPRQVVLGNFGEVFLLDWGLAISLRDEVPEVARADNLPKFKAAETATDRSGSPAYMAPEQAAGGAKALGVHTDVYLLGATLYELIAGVPPHAAASASEACLLALGNAYPPLPPECPDDLRAIAERALATEPAARFASAAELRDAVEEHLSGAGRQRESKDIAALAREWFADAGENAGYDVFGDIDKLLGRALALWPNNAEAFELRQRVYARYSELAIAAGDLRLAKSLLPSLLDPELREERANSLREAEERAARHARQRRQLLAASGLLLALLLFAAIYGLAQAYLAAKESARREAVERAAGQQQELVELFAFRERERDLAARLVAAHPSPTSIDPPPPASPATLEAWREEIAKAARERALIASRPFAKAALGDAPPFDLALGEANLELAAGDPARALELYERCSEAHPERPEPMAGVGAALARAGDAAGAADWLSRAARRALELHGARHPEHLRALALKMAAVERLDPSNGDYERFSRETIEQLEPIWAELGETLAVRWGRLGERALALRYATEALEARRRSLGDAHPSTGAAREAVAKLAAGAAVEHRP